MADYISTLTGVQMDAALIDMAEHNSEAYAVGERSGIPVVEGDVTYHNNARYYASQAQSIAPASVTEAVRWDVAQTALTDANKALARSNIDAGKNGAWTNPNLLDNPFFTIRQRGDGAFTGNVYGLDRWRGGNSRTTIAGDSGYITLSTNSSGNGILRQILPQTYEGTYTFSVMVGGSGSGAIALQDSGGTFIGTTVEFTVSGDTQLVTTTFTTSGTAIGGVIVRVDASNSINVYSAKLEKGSVSTLTNDTPPDYGTELAKCQYYCRVFNTTNGYFYLGGYCQSTTQFRSYALPPMRQATSGSPTVTMTGTATIYKVDGATVSVTSLSSAWLSIANGGVTLFANVSSGLTAGTPATLRIDQGSLVVISTDL